VNVINVYCQSRWQGALRLGLAAVRFLVFRVQMPQGEWGEGLFVVSVVCRQVEVSATGRSLVQRSHAEE
jgi:hypothetical protein